MWKTGFVFRKRASPESFWHPDCAVQQLHRRFHMQWGLRRCFVANRLPQPPESVPYPGVCIEWRHADRVSVPQPVHPPAERLDCCFAMHPFVTTFPGSACPVCRQNPIRSVYAAAAEVVPASDIGVVPVVIIGEQFGEDSFPGTGDFHSGDKPIAPERCITELIVQLQAVPESIKG